MVHLLVDGNLDGHAKLAGHAIPLRDVARKCEINLDIRFLHLEQVGLDRNTKDDIVWRLCQQQGYYLLTANRNRESEDSLEATISAKARPIVCRCSPSPTPIASTKVHAYLEEVVESLLDYLLYAENCRGTGRLYLPVARPPAMKG